MDYTKVTDDIQFNEKVTIDGVTFRPALTKDYIHAKYKKFNFRVYQDRDTKKYKSSISNGMISLDTKDELFDTPEIAMATGVQLINGWKP